MSRNAVINEAEIMCSERISYILLFTSMKEGGGSRTVRCDYPHMRELEL